MKTFCQLGWKQKELMSIGAMLNIFTITCDETSNWKVFVQFSNL